jgi:hypothetical protein
MPHLTNRLTRGSPLITLYVGISDERRIAFTKAGRTPPEMRECLALIDTGASDTCIDPAILKPLELTPTGHALIHTPSTAGQPHSCDFYDVSLGIYHPKDSMILLTVPVIAVDLGSQGITALIGRNVLASCLFIFDGASDSFTLAF